MTSSRLISIIKNIKTTLQSTIHSFFLIIFSIFFLATFTQTHSQEIDSTNNFQNAFSNPFNSKNKIELLFSGGRTSTYYGTKSEPRLFDVIGTTFTKLNFIANYSRFVSRNLTLNFSFPVMYSYLQSDSIFPERSLLKVESYDVGLDYFLLNADNFRLGVASEIKIPTGFYNSLYDDPKFPTFLSDGFFQFNNSLLVNYGSDGQFANLKLGYNKRYEEATDEFAYSFEAGISRTKGTAIKILCNGVYSLEDAATPTRPFYAGSSGTSLLNEVVAGGKGNFYSVERENYTNVGAMVIAYINKDIFIKGSYQIKLLGQNSLLLNFASIAFGTNF